MTVLVCGSIAYDNIMVFDGQFKDHILPDKVHILNVSFLVPELRREFGGCAGNIAYNMKMLGGDVVPMASVGSDFEPYSEWMNEQGIDQTYVKRIASSYTAQAYITTDKDDNQITAFHPGAMNYAHENRIPADSGIKFGIVAPDGRDGMLQHADQFAAASIPFIFDPGQGLPMFSGEELLDFVDKATWVAVNDYESELLANRTGKSIEDIAGRVEALIVTRGGEGSFIYTTEGKLEIPVIKPEAIVDPTGCGDAYRAGLLFGLQNSLDWQTTGNIASLAGSIKIAHHGTQNHRYTPEGFSDHFERVFGYRYR
ncbi:MAG: carbohydrate kinase family protein [Gammaproteobacteria bacterium]